MISYNTSEKKKETEEDMEGGLLFQRHVQFSALNMPAREESFFNTADPGPSPNTMISGFLNDSDENDYQNTLDSQMFGSGMNDKKTEAGSRYSFGARLAARQGGTTSDSGGLKSTPHIIPHRLFTIPQGISPSMLIDSPILFSPIQALPSPTTGSFLIDMKKEEDNANESRGFVFKAGSANNAFEQIADMANFSQHNSFSSQEWTENGPAAVTSSGTENAATNSPSPPLEPEDQAEIFPQAVMERSSDDGYNWRKYGQKQVKGSAYPRSYYKCTHPTCPVKKKVERSLDGQVTEIVYKGDHSHEPPQKLRRLSLMDPDSYRRNLDRTSSGDGYSSFSQRSGSNVEPSSPSFEDDDTDPSNRSNADGEEDDLDRKRKRENEPHEPACAQRTIREPRVVVQTKSDIDILDDGYRWRKYGQKVVKGNPYPRSYYKCTNAGCPVRKHVERASNDPKSVITTYEAKHNHDVPLPKNSSSHENPYMSMLPSTSNAQMRSAQISATSIQDQLALAAVKNDTDLEVKDQASSGSFPYRPQIAIRPKLEQDDGLSYTSFFNSSHQNNY